MALSPGDKKTLEDIHDLFLEIEKSMTSASRIFAKDEKLKILKSKIKTLSTHPHPEIARLSATEKHLAEEMTLKHFVNFAIPFERLLNKKLRDDEFLIIEQDQETQTLEKRPLVFVLDNIRSAFNVGSLFRTAECLGAEKIFLCGYTPTPEQQQLKKTAMGTDEYLPWEEFAKTKDCLLHLKAEGYKIVGLETSHKAIDLYEDFSTTATAFVLGNERFGLDVDILNLLDEVRLIPLRGRKNSLNVGVTAAVAGFEWARQWQKAQR